ncbi:hypothetical protein QOT17_004963 [Balamuthia mandrillaris]
MHSIKEFLSTQTLQHMKEIEQQKLVVLPSSMMIEKAFDKLMEEHILCAPVANEEGRVLGLVDVKDFVEYILLIYGKSTRSVQELELDAEFSVKNIKNLSLRNPLLNIGIDAPLITVLELFQSGIHRLAVSDGDINNITHMVSQGSVISFLLDHLDRLGDYAQKAISALPHFGTKAQPVQENISVLSAFEFIHKHKFHGTAIVSKQGELVGSISVTDLKYAADNIERLEVPLCEFWEKEEWERRKEHLLTCTEDDTFGEVVRKLKEGRVHRLFVVEKESFRPLRVISLTDVMRAVLAFAEEEEQAKRRNEEGEE